MNAIVSDRLAATTEHTNVMSARIAAFPDPLDADDVTDEVIVTTRRAIGRVALVASETAGRFQREAIEHDPMSWMFAPRRVFDGAAAIDACLDRDACMRGILIHGLGLGLDVERSAVDALLAEEGDGEFDEHEFGCLHGDGAGRSGRADRGRSGRVTRLRLYTATIVETRDNVMTQAFHASVARDIYEVRARLVGRYGPDLGAAADIRLGVHIASPLVVAMVPAAVIELIRQMHRDSSAEAARKFAVDIQQAIQA